MQLFAHDSNKILVSASHANKQTDYFCLECSGIVRRRGGLHRHTHFYHLGSEKPCRQNGKSMAHLQTQFAIKSILPDNECFLEYRFEKINRIADVVWLTKKLIFEIQCSNITAQEVKARNQDYRSQGFQVIWILHDRQFNKRRLTAAEQYLRDHPHYFTNINEDGVGIIYDQLEAVGVKREKLWGPFAIDVLQWNEIKATEQLQRLSPLILSRVKRKHFFEGDFLSAYLKNPETFAELNKEEPQEKKVFLDYLWKPFRFAGRLYHLFFQILLERACR